MKRYSILLLSALIGAICYAGNAVSEPNGKVGFSTGSMDGNTGQNVEGSISFPLGTNFGFQVDALYTDVSHREFYGMGTHLFWRDSKKALLGLTAGGIYEEDLYSWMGGIESEYYLKKVTLGLQGGVARIKYDTGPLPFIDTDRTDYSVSAKAGFYPIDDLFISLAHTRVFDNGLTQAQIEYQTPLDGLSLFADIAQGEHDYDHALVGLRYYFGSKKSLKLRHREDDPPNILNSVLYTMESYGMEFEREANDYEAAQKRDHPEGGLTEWATREPLLSASDMVLFPLEDPEGRDRMIRSTTLPRIPINGSEENNTLNRSFRGSHGAVSIIAIGAPRINLDSWKNMNRLEINRLIR